MASFDRQIDFLLVGHCKYSSILYHFRDKRSKITIFSYPLHSTPHASGWSLAKYCYTRFVERKTRMAWIPDGEKSLSICL